MLRAILGIEFLKPAFLGRELVFKLFLFRLIPAFITNLFSALSGKDRKFHSQARVYQFQIARGCFNVR